MLKTLFWWQVLSVVRTEDGAVLAKYNVLAYSRDEARKILNKTEPLRPGERTFGLHKVGTHDDYMDIFGVDGQMELDIEEY